jgi:predicted CxxxxCH...CXXCH cytochrome family protein
VAPNTPPTARFTFSCSGLTCHFDGTGSSDDDRTIASYAWDFGDGSGVGGSTADHTYRHAAGYIVTLTVTNNNGATGSRSKTATPISLVARGYKLGGLERVDLSWTGPAGASVDIYRDTGKVGTVHTNAYTDKLNKKGPGTYTYKVCAAATSVCSNDATVSF